VQRELVAASATALGEHDPATLGRRVNHGVLLHHLGRREDAEQEQRSTLAVCDEVLGAEHPITVGCRRSLALIREG
jgi:hypothetical protein